MVKSLDWREGLRPIWPLHFFLFTYLQKGELGTVGETGSLVAEYIEKRGWFPGQSGSQTYGYEGGVSLRQVLGYTALVPTPTSGSQRSSLRGSLAVSFTLTHKLNKKVRCLCWQGWGRSLQQILGVSSQGLPRAGPLATPALAVGRAQPPQAVAVGRRMLYWPHWGMCPHQPPTQTACLKANKSMPRAGNRQIDT